MKREDPSTPRRSFNQLRSNESVGCLGTRREGAFKIHQTDSYFCKEGREEGGGRPESLGLSGSRVSLGYTDSTGEAQSVAGNHL